MADNITIKDGSGATVVVISQDTGGGLQLPGHHIADPTTPSQKMGIDSGGRPTVNINGTVTVTAGSLPLPAGAATAANQSAEITGLAAIVSALGVPFQAGGSIGNTTFASTVADGGNVTQGAIADASVTAGATGTVSAKLRRISADIGTILTGIASLVTGTVLAPGIALIGAVAAALRTDSIMNGTTSLTPKYAFATLSSTGSVVALVSLKKIRVLRYSMMADAACTAYFRTVASTTQISGTKYMSATGGAGGTFSPVGHFETLSGEALGLFIVGTANVSVDLVYIEV